jgi:hypothetical protein
MKKLCAAQVGMILLASIAGSAAAQAGVDWQAVKKISPSTGILVETQTWTHCYLDKVTDESLSCLSSKQDFTNRDLRGTPIVFQRNDVRAVRVERYDYSSGYLSFLAAAGGGGGWGSAHQGSAFAGVKIGGQFSLDLQYDRIGRHNGFSTEGSAVLPLLRVPSFRKVVDPGSDMNADSRFVKLYAEPGVGYRAGSGPFGGYTSAKAMLLFFPHSGAQPYVEFQRRFPFSAPMQGDNRVSVGLMATLCEHCGWD